MAVTVPDASYPYAYNITARQADTYTQQFTFTGQDFTGYTLAFNVLDLYDKKPILTITPTLSSLNTITVTRTATQMDVRAGRYRYVFEATDGSGVNVEYLKGVFTILDDVNDSTEDTIEEDGGEPQGYTVTIIDEDYEAERTNGTEIILADATSEQIDITLPSAVGNEAMFIIQKTDSSANTVTDGTNIILFQHTSYTLISNGTAWVRIQ